ncbi:MAG TPA: membrane protein insertase YidC, partial [Burkholderiales bacterium]|nr:membrane protein insertase YidC [Burkholderiales bacterium]
GFEIANKTGEAIQPYAYSQLVRDAKPPVGDSAMVPTFTGMAVYTDKEKFHKITFEEIDKGKATFPKNSNDGWIAMLQHYFFGAWLPKEGAPREFYAHRLDGGLYSAGVIVPVGSIAPGAIGAVNVPLYAGPEEQRKLAAIAPGLDLTVDYGWLTVIAVPLFWVLEWLHQWVKNWGVAIIILTIIIKLLFYPLSAASYRSMAKMRVVAPKMQRLKDQYGNDRQRMQQAMMELYKTERINPLGGCMPIVVQIPVFIALYWVLLASVELRHAPFMLWIDDLASPDPWFVLPLLMGATMIIQTLLNPEPPDPVQAKVMKIMPVVFSIFFFFFPAGLVLYWLVNNILSIAQQWHITRTLEREAATTAARKR